MLPTQKGVSLITVLPEELQSPLLTAEWEHKLKQIEKGELESTLFLQEITEMVQGLVQNSHPVPESSVLFTEKNEKHWRMPAMRQRGCGTSQRLSVQQPRLPLCVMAAKSLLCRKEKGTDCCHSVGPSERRTGIRERAVFSKDRQNL